MSFYNFERNTIKDNLIFKAPKQRKPRIKAGTAVIKVTASAYNAVEEISAKTGLSNSYIASQMILYASERTDIMYYDGEQESEEA